VFLGKYLTNPDGTKVGVHGFGLSAPEPMLRYPWASVDSTTWWRLSRFGFTLMDIPWNDGSITDVKIDLSETSPRQDVPNSWHNTFAARRR
jgi:hypothetical protein